MGFVALTDFTGIYSLAFSNGLDPVIQSYIDRLEKPTLNKLLGKPLADLLLAYNDLAKVSQTIGPLVIGKSYYIDVYNAGDDFTNVGAASNAAGVYFIATGDTPAVWTNLSSLISNRVKRYDDLINPFYIENDINGDNDWMDGCSCKNFYESYGVKDILLIEMYYEYVSKEQSQNTGSGVVSQAAENGNVLGFRNAFRKGESKWNGDGISTWNAIRWYCLKKYPEIYPEYNGTVPKVRYTSII